jgi:peptidoglycan/LPS O-acetylase OafA/YrhL
MEKLVGEPMSTTTKLSGEILPITGIRGLAALWVVACHWAGPELTGVGRDIALHGYAAVDLFMLLSGFVLGLSHASRVKGSVWSGYGHFLLQRLGRLYPLYLLTTLACLALALLRGESWITPGVLASNLLMADTTFWDENAIDGPSWAVSVEWTLNLFFPLFVFFCLRLSRRWSYAIAVLCAAVLVLTSVLEVQWNHGIPGSLGVLDNRLIYLRCAPEFTLGLLIWRWWEAAGRTTRFSRPGWVVGCFAVMLATLPYKSMDFPFVLAACLLLPALAEGSAPLVRLFAWRPLVWVGTISFSLYLWHAAFIPLRDLIAGIAAGLGPQAAGMLANTATLALVLAFSSASHRWFEAPMRRWMRRAVG